jgi:hypothetical protein
MSWAARRRFIIVCILGGVVLAFVIILLIVTLYKTPSCSDGIQNQGEQGIDCGGPCPYLCTAQEQAPVVLFTTPIANGRGGTDVIASIENKNTTAAAKAVPYTITIYGSDQSLIKQVQGNVDLPPGATVSVFVPNIPTGQQTAATAFLAIDPSSPQWYTLATDPRILPAVSNTVLGGITNAPIITATLTNPSPTILTNIVVDVLVHAANGNVIAASQTLLQTIPGQGEATATWTWNSPFSSTAASIEVDPVIPLP